MDADRKSLDPVSRTQPEAGGSVLYSTPGWRRWLIALGALCVLAAPDRHASAALKCPASQPSVNASVDFVAFTQNKPFRLNTCMTTPYGPA